MPPAKSARTELRYYVAWIDKRTDPWPNWQTIQPDSGGVGRPAPNEGGSAPNPVLEGRAVEFLPVDHPDWPGMPFVRGIQPPTVVDGRMGRFAWPGVQLADGSGRVYLGPTLSALLHPDSTCNLSKLEKAFLLYQPEAPDSPWELLHRILLDVAKRRGISQPDKRVECRPIEGLSDPTDYKAITEKVHEWRKNRDPFRFGNQKMKDGLATARVFVNLSTGTPAMCTSWVLLWNNGTLGRPPKCTVEFVQGDGGLDPRAGPEAANFGPMRTVPIDALSLAGGAAPVPAAPSPTPGDEIVVEIEALNGPPYDALRQQIDRAARLGLPVFLEGQRGSGKTFLAEYAHRRHMYYRQELETCFGQIPIPRSGFSKRDDRPALGPPLDETGGRFVSVSLSQYAGARADELRDELFGWAKGAFTGHGADKPNDGLLGLAHRGTLFLDEIHHLDHRLQPMLLGPFNIHQLNDRRYQPKMAQYLIISDFYLVLASNDVNWRDKLLPDLCDRLERVVLEVPSFADVRRSSAHTLWQFWDYTLRRRCADCRVEYGEQGEWTECRRILWKLLQSNPLPGNWRDLQRLADNVLLLQSTHQAPAELHPLTGLVWSRPEVEEAIRRTFGGTRAACPAP